VLVDYGASVTVGGGTPAAAASTFNTLIVAGDAYLDSPVTVSDLEESNGLVQLAQAGTWKTNPMANEIDTIHVTGGKLDLDGQDVLTYTDVATIRARLASMYDGGAWDGSTGIFSSYAPNSLTSYAVGYATSDDNSVTGLTLSAGQMLIRPTVAGDATVDGTNDTADFTAWRNNFYNGDRWAQGDFNYDGVLDTSDFTIWRNCFYEMF
jgi:hypothetical protein